MASKSSNAPQPPPKSVVDRSIVPLLSNPDETPSRRLGIAANVERKHRLYGTSILLAACHILKLNSASTYGTACTIFHRFYHRVSLTQHCVWSVALGSLLLATKVEDGPQQRTVRQLILVMDHLYRKRRRQQQQQQQQQRATAATDTCNSDHNSNNINVTVDVLPMPKLGPVWKEWYEMALDMENRILRELGFTLYWIPDSHPHKFLWAFWSILLGLDDHVALQQDTNDAMDNGDEDEDNKKETRHYELAQRSWNYCNDSHRLDLCVHFDSEVITCAAMYLAAMDFDLTLPLTPRPWWEFFLGKDDNNVKQNGDKPSRCKSRGEEVSIVANAMLGLEEYERNNPSNKGYLTSLVPNGGSFLDPDSFLWESRA